MNLFKVGISFTFFVFITCDKITDPVFIVKSDFSGIVYTNSYGEISKEDIEDWQPRIPPSEIDTTGWRNLRPTHFSIKPAFPNPAGVDSARGLEIYGQFGCYILYEIPELSDVDITVNVRQDSIVRTIIKGKQQTGTHVFVWDLKNDIGQPLPNAIYRMYFNIQTRDTIYKSFGDILIQRKIQ